MRPPKSLLKDSHPELAREIIDQTLLPSLATGSDKTIEWQGSCGHKWNAKVYNRTNSKNPTGCPICAGKQVLIGFNDLHTTQPAIAALCKNSEDAYTVTEKSNKVLNWKCNNGHTWRAPVARLVTQGHHCPYCIGKTVLPGFNDIATTHPEIAKELVDQTLATKLQAGSNKQVQWKCKENHVWTTNPYSRTHNHTHCPYCSGRTVIAGKNDLATLYPALITKMVKPALAKQIGVGSDIRVEWRCDKHPEHTWFTTPNNRLKSNCPICADRQVLTGFNDLATTHPALAKELADPTLATKITHGSNKRVKWKCSKGHTWYIEPYHRTGIRPTGCPICNPTGVSNAEKQLVAVLRQLIPNTTIIENDTTILDGKIELDIVIPAKHIAIEFNGVRWHSELTNKTNTYHLDKSRACTLKDYQLIHIWEDDWNNRSNNVIKLLAYKLHVMNQLDTILPNEKNCCETIFARKLNCTIINHTDAAKFLNDNHIQGAVTSTYHFALIDNAQIIRAVMSVRSPKNNARMKRKDGEWEIQRYATCGSIPGGFSKLLSYAEKTIRNNDQIITSWISFSSNDISNGDLYQKTGFVKIKELPPDYCYVGDYTKWIRKPKERFQKKYFKANPNLLWQDNWTEHQAALANKLYRIYDAGKIKWCKQINSPS